jgi:hypothetical protein
MYNSNLGPSHRDSSRCDGFDVQDCRLLRCICEKFGRRQTDSCRCDKFGVGNSRCRKRALEGPISLEFNGVQEISASVTQGEVVHTERVGCRYGSYKVHGQDR